MDGGSHRCATKTEEGMWAVLRRHLMTKRVAGAAGSAGPCGLWKVTVDCPIQSVVYTNMSNIVWWAGCLCAPILGWLGATEV